MVKTHAQDKTLGMDRKHRFGVRLKALRAQRGLSQEELAAAIDRSVDALSKIERGVTLPSLETLCRLGESLSVPLADLVEPIDSSGRHDPELLILETKISDIVRSLDKPTLSVALEQLQALARHHK